jgi:lysozyme
MRGQAARAGAGPPASEGPRYFNARWYDPTTGRFISEDPVLDGTLWYAYVNNNPMTFVDPTGLEPYEYTTTGEDWTLNIVRNLMEQTGDESLSRMAAASRDRNAEGHVEAYRYVQSKVEAVDEVLRSAGIDVGTKSAGETIRFNEQWANELFGVQSASASGVSTAGVEFIKEYERFSSTVYKDAAGYQTIGYGHRVLPGEDLSGFTDAVLDFVKVPLKQHQFDALVSFAYNVGRTGFRKSTVVASVNAGRSPRENLLAYVTAGGAVSQGLVNRRTDEWELYNTGDYQRDY